MKPKLFLPLLLIFFISLIKVCLAQELSAKEIVKRSDDLMRGDSFSGAYLMQIKTPTWERELKLYVYSVGREKITIRIIAPDKEKGIGTLRIKNEMWNYLPRVEKTIKIPPSLMLEPWMGSDFDNDDLVKESSIVHDYDHKIVAEEKMDGFDSYKIELIPKPNAPVVWGKIIRWVRKNDFLPLKEEYYNEKENLIKSLKFNEPTFFTNRTVPRVWKMTSVTKPGHTTTIRILDIIYNIPINESVFSVNFLKQSQ
jgi:outer membrane lipoprotein-sorting protein